MATKSSHRISGLLFKWLFFLVTFFVTTGSCLFWSINNTQAGQENVKKLLILHSYHQGFLWTDKVMTGISSLFTNENIPVELYVEYMDTKRQVPDQTFPLLKQLYAEKFRQIEFDVIILSDNNALDFILANRDELFPRVPIVFCGINNLDMAMLGEHKAITGVAEDISVGSTIQLMLRLHPQTKKIVVINDRTVTGIQNKMKLQQTVAEFKGAVDFVELDDVSIAELRENLSSLPDGTVLLLFTFHRDRNGQQFTINEYFSEITSYCDLPIYSFWEHYLGGGIVGGVLTNGQAHGLNAARMALAIMQGESPEKIPVLLKSPNLPMFDYLQIRKYGISEKDLPKTSLVINKPISLYEEYKIIVWSLLTVFTLLLGLVISLSVNILRRRQMEKELKRHRDHLEELVEERTVELSKTNQALMDSEEKHRNLSETAFEGIVISEKGIFLEVNKTMSDMFGYNSSELLGMKATDLVVSEERENVRSKISSGYEQVYETNCQKKDGSVFPAEIRAKMFTYMGRQVRGSAIRDISEQKMAEEKLQLAFTRLRTVLDAVDAMIYVADIETYEILLINRYVHKHFGDIEGKRCWEALQVGQNGPCGFCQIHKLCKDDQMLSSHVWEVQNTKNGEWYEYHDEALEWVDGRHVRIQVATNISERIKNEYEREKLITKLEKAITEIKTLRGILPVCCVCGLIRDDTGVEQGKGEWMKVDKFVTQKTDAKISHSYCPKCYEKAMEDI